MGKMNSTCFYEYNFDGRGDLVAKARELGTNYAFTAVLERNGTYTLHICERKQFKPPKKYDNGTRGEKEDLDQATKREFRKREGDTSSDTTNTTKQREKSPDGYDGKTYDKTRTDWGTDDTASQRDPTQPKAEKGYGQPSKGTYSMELGGFKSFGTEGQGNQSAGVKDDYDTTCGDRVMLITVDALHDTYEEAAAPPPPPRAVQSTHPVVLATTSFLTLEVGNYQFIDELGGTAEAGSKLYMSWLVGTLMLLMSVSIY